MTHIHLLSDELISQIAAGEVIERPASAVKELVENSIDAEAGFIAIELNAGGLQKIRISDDGVGMDPENAKMAFLRHATSKIEKLEDLFSIKSLGFRGEALASIASISRVTMKTRAQSDATGTLLVIDGNRQEVLEETACSCGTDITVTNLFQHTPVRKKYMKSEATEYGHCFDLICQIALAHSAVSFRLSKDGEEVFLLPKNQDLRERIRSIYGGSIADALVPIFYNQSNLKITGFVGRPELARSTKKYQFLFVNGRAIESRFVSRAVMEAFHSLLMHEKYPWYAINIEIDPEFLDVNVHPRKMEVKFLNNQEVYNSIFGAVHHALSNMNLSPVNGRIAMPNRTIDFDFKSFVLVEQNGPMASHDVHENRTVFSIKGVALRPIAQIANSYIIAESEEGLAIIDQHAGHERVRYEKLIQSIDLVPAKQPLLTPLQIDLGADGVRIMQKYGKDFESLGYEIDYFGGSTFFIRAVPLELLKRDPEKLFLEVLSDLSEELKNHSIKNVREAIAKMTACKGAIKFGDALTMQEMQALLLEMEKTANSTHCPHGRPAIVTLTFDKLEELFKRKNF